MKNFKKHCACVLEELSKPTTNLDTLGFVVGSLSKCLPKPYLRNAGIQNLLTSRILG